MNPFPTFVNSFGPTWVSDPQIISLIDLNLKSIYFHRLGFLHSLPFHQLSPLKLNKGSETFIYSRVYLLLFCILATSKVKTWQVLTCDSAHSWWRYSAAPTGKPGHQHHDPIPHSVTLSWHWANQSLSYPNNAEHLARKRQVSIL